MNTTKLALLLLLIAAAAGGVFFMLKSDGGGSLPPQSEPLRAPVEEPPSPAIRTPTRVTPQANPDRTTLPQTSPSGSEYGQGVMGTVIDPSNRPVVGAKVYLMEGSMSNIFQRVRAIQDGVVFPPTASDVTNENGEFRLGLRQTVPGTTFEVRIITDAYADHRLPNLTIQRNDWYDARLIRLQQGTLIRGRVTVEGEGMGVPNATVYINEVGTVMQISPTPGREEGLKIAADENGYFEVRNGPTGIADISAAAPYFARAYKRQVTLDTNNTNEVNFTLSRGLAIRGVVVDPNGTPVRGAKVMATSLLPKQPQSEEARTGGDGRFEFLSLVEAPFQLSAMAQGFQRRDEKPVQAGSEDVRLVLDKQGAARVKVFGRNGRMMRAYTLNVKSHFEVQDQIGNVQNQAPRNIRAGDLENGFAKVEGLNPGNYVFQVDHQDYARTFSQPFTVGPGIPPPDVEVRMSAGGSLIGTVVDATGAPIGGVAIQTQTNGTVENPFLTMLSGIVPKKITETSTRTDAQGRYRFDALAMGTYQLKFTHPEYCEGVLIDLVLNEGQSTNAPPLRMVPGTLVTGTTMVDGVATGQVKVTIQLSTEGGQASAGMFLAEAVSNSRGEYVITKRVPPGTYQIQATRQPENPFGMIADYERTRQTFSLRQGQTELRLDVNVPSR